MPDSLDPDLFKNIIIETAKPAILPLVKRFFQQNGMRPQAARDDQIIIARLSDQPGTPIIAALRLCPLEDHWLLRSMCVDENYQRQGIGRYILNQIRQILSEKQCYCFAYRSLHDFYHHAGFTCPAVAMVPSIIADRFRQYARSKELVLMQFNAG